MKLINKYHKAIFQMRINVTNNVFHFLYNNKRGDSKIFINNSFIKKFDKIYSKRRVKNEYKFIEKLKEDIKSLAYFERLS